MKINELFSNFGNNISFKKESLKDKEFLLSLYSSTREDELLISSMNQIEKKNFIQEQFQLRQVDYKKRFHNAHFLLICRKKKNIGRVVFDVSNNIHLIDIAFVKKSRSCGFGTKIINKLISYAKNQKQTFRLSVCMDNPKALKLYERLGLKIVGTEGYYYSMEISFQEVENKSL
ncbi:GNAT family N-acetyltransferase [Malaciobacter sp. WC5094]